MAKRRGHPIGAVFVGLLTLLLAAALGVLAAGMYSDWGAVTWGVEPNPNGGLGALFAGLAAVAFLVGLWSAWWVGTGRGGRLGRLATVCLVGLLTTGATFGVAFGSRTRRELVPVAVLVSLSGLWLALRVGTGRWGLRKRPEREGGADG